MSERTGVEWLYEYFARKMRTEEIVERIGALDERIRVLERENAILTDAMKKEIAKVRALEAKLAEYTQPEPYVVIAALETELAEANDRAHGWQNRVEKAEAEVERLKAVARLCPCESLHFGPRTGGGRESGVSGERHREDVKDVETTRPTAANRSETIPPAKPAAPLTLGTPLLAIGALPITKPAVHIHDWHGNGRHGTRLCCACRPDLYGREGGCAVFRRKNAPAPAQDAKPATKEAD